MKNMKVKWIVIFWWKTHNSFWQWYKFHCKNVKLWINTKLLWKMKIMGSVKVNLQVIHPCLTFPSCNPTFINLVFQRPLWDIYLGKESTDLEEDSIRNGNTLWCSFGKCRPMATRTESLCYLDENEISESYFEGMN